MAFTPQVVIPAPRTWTTGQIIKAPYLRADVTDAVAFLLNRPSFAGANQAATSLASGSDLVLPMATEFFDNWAGHSTSTNNSRYYCQLPGWYLCTSTTPWNFTTATQFLFLGGFQGKSGGSTLTVVRGARQPANTNNPVPQTVDLIEQTVTGAIGGAGDYIEPTVLQNTGGALALQNSSNNYPNVVIRWVASASGTVSLPVPDNPSWATLVYLTSAFLNANIRDTINFLLYPPILRAHYTAGTTTLPNQAFPAGTVVTLTTVDIDNYSGFTTGASAKYTAPVSGNYFCYGQLNLAATSTQFQKGVGFSVNGGTTIWGEVSLQTSDGSNGFGVAVQKRLRLTAGDTLQLVGTQNSGGAVAINTATADQTRMIVVWEGT